MSWLWILLAAVAQPVMIIHSSPALLISQCYKLSHESLCIDPVIACVFSKVSWCLGKTESCEKKYLQTFKTTWHCILIFCQKIVYKLTIR